MISSSLATSGRRAMEIAIWLERMARRPRSRHVHAKSSRISDDRLGECVSRIVFASDDAPMPTAVRMDAAAYELIRVRCDELLLPRLERDLSRMLLAGPVLWEHCRPPAPVRSDEPASALSAKPDTSGHEQRDRSRRFGDDARRAVVEKDPEKVCLWRSIDVAVAEVQPQEIDVSGVLVLVEGLEPPLYRF